MSNSVKDPARDRSGRGLPPKNERRALGKAAAAARARAKRRRQLLRTFGSAAAVVVVVGGLAVGCTLLNSSGTPTANSSAPPAASAGPTATPDPIDPAFDPQLHQRPVILGATDNPTQLVKTMIVTGPGPAVQSGQTITVNYVGATYANGNVFDTTWDKRRRASRSASGRSSRAGTRAWSVFRSAAGSSSTSRPTSPTAPTPPAASRPERCASWWTSSPRSNPPSPFSTRGRLPAARPGLRRSR